MARADPDHRRRSIPGADVSGAGTLRSGLIFAGLILPVFVYRHYIQDNGKFPAALLEELGLAGAIDRSGVKPWH